MRAGHELLCQVLGVCDDGGHDEPRLGVRPRESIEVLGEGRVLAVGHAVAAKPPTAQLGGDDLEAATTVLCGACSTSAAASSVGRQACCATRLRAPSRTWSSTAETASPTAASGTVPF